MHTHSGQIQNNNNMKWWQLYIKKWNLENKRCERNHPHRGEFVAGIANEHAGLPYSSITNGHALDESWGSCGSHWNNNNKKKKKKLSQNNLNKTKQTRSVGVLLCDGLLKIEVFFSFIDRETDRKRKKERERKSERVAALHMILIHSLFFVPANWFIFFFSFLILVFANAIFYYLLFLILVFCKCIFYLFSF